MLALNPEEPQFGLEPFVMSFSTYGCSYSVGLTKPTGPFPAAVLSSLMRVMTEANIGEANEVLEGGQHVLQVVYSRKVE